MCGIAGILRTWTGGEAPGDTFEAIPEAWLDVLDESIKHRGPDGCGRFRQRVVRDDGTVVDVALVHRRLSIIDHAGGAQPMVVGEGGGAGGRAVGGTGGREDTGGQAASGTEPLISRDGLPYGPLRAHVCPKCGPGPTAVVFNGCIYNHRELRRELEASGHEFFTDHSDTEVLVHGWREWGAGLTERLEGMYALLIWDAAKGAFVAARDLFGEKPLYVLALGDADFITFASAPGALPVIASDEGVDELDGEAAGEWARFGYDAVRTPFISVRQSPHASVLRLRAASLDQAEWGNRRLGPGLGARLKRALPVPGASRSTEDRIEALLRASVANRLEADVPVGCLLSGGVDSSLIALCACDALEGAELTTICVRMPDDRYDESRYAQAVADRLGTRHIVVDAELRPAEDLLLLIETMGLPFGDSSLLPTFWACRAAAGEVGVLLSGDGGDELFLGYERYVSVKFLEMPRMLSWASPVLGLAADAVPRRDPKSRSDKAARFVLAGMAGSGQAYQELLAIFPRRDARRLLGRLYRRSWLEDPSIESPLEAREYDLEHHLPGDLLRKVDFASMGAGVELRSPFLDTALAEAALALPVQRLMPRGKRKGLLRAIARKYLPAEIVDRPKMGFAIPVGEWFRTDYGGMRQLLYDHLESAEPFPGLAEAGVELNIEFVRRMLREHDAAGEKSRNPWHGRDHSQRLYMLLVLSIWCRWLRRVG